MCLFFVCRVVAFGAEDTVATATKEKSPNPFPAALAEAAMKRFRDHIASPTGNSTCSAKPPSGTFPARLAAQGSGPLLQPREPGTRRSLRRHAVVGDRDPDAAVVEGQRYVDAASTGMPQDVGQALLQGAVEDELGLRGQLAGAGTLPVADGLLARWVVG